MANNANEDPYGFEESWDSFKKEMKNKKYIQAPVSSTKSCRTIPYICALSQQCPSKFIITKYSCFL